MSASAFMSAALALVSACIIITTITIIMFGAIGTIITASAASSRAHCAEKAGPFGPAFLLRAAGALNSLFGKFS